MRTQGGLQGALGETSTPGLFIECIVGSGWKRETRKWSISGKPMKNNGSRARVGEVEVAMFCASCKVALMKHAIFGIREEGIRRASVSWGTLIPTDILHFPSRGCPPRANVDSPKFKVY